MEVEAGCGHAQGWSPPRTVEAARSSPNTGDRIAKAWREAGSHRSRARPHLRKSCRDRGQSSSGTIGLSRSAWRSMRGRLTFRRSSPAKRIARLYQSGAAAGRAKFDVVSAAGRRARPNAIIQTHTGRRARSNATPNIKILRTCNLRITSYSPDCTASKTDGQDSLAGKRHQ